jgi:ribose-phosphate pyrophosphokinase
MIIDIENNIGVKTWAFPGGEVHCKLSDEVVNYIMKGNVDIPIISRCKNPSDFMMLVSVLLSISRINFTTIKSIKLLLPYLPYQQADRVFSAGEPLGLDFYKKIIYAIPNLEIAIYAIDVHSNSGADTIDKEISPELAVMNAIEQSPKDVVLVLPDKGAFDRVARFDYWKEKVAPNYTVIHADKHRPNDGGEPVLLLTTEDLLKLNGKDILIIDDICVGGRTFINLVELIDKFTIINRASLYVTHGVFSNGLKPLLDKFDNIYTTNTYRDFSKIDDVWVIHNEKLFSNRFHVYDYDFAKLVD